MEPRLKRDRPAPELHDAAADVDPSIRIDGEIEAATTTDGFALVDTKALG